MQSCQCRYDANVSQQEEMQGWGSRNDTEPAVLADLILLRAGEGNLVLRHAALFLGYCRPQARMCVEAAAYVPRDIGPVEGHLQKWR
jgi:hypothetical protein